MLSNANTRKVFRSRYQKMKGNVSTSKYQKMFSNASIENVSESVSRSIRKCFEIEPLGNVFKCRSENVFFKLRMFTECFQITAVLQYSRHFPPDSRWISSFAFFIHQELHFWLLFIFERGWLAYSPMTSSNVQNTRFWLVVDFSKLWSTQELSSLFQPDACTLKERNFSSLNDDEKRMWVLRMFDTNKFQVEKLIPISPPKSIPH